LSPGKKGCYRLHIHSRIWRKLKIDAGAEVEVTLMLDEAPRPAIVPPDLAKALAAKPVALKMFNALTLPLRRQVLWYLNNAKHASTREKRVKLMVQRMLERAEKAKEKGKKATARNKPAKRQGSRKR
jgi:Bacteriocin-protection, YdeI or OmpD-Associated